MVIVLLLIPLLTILSALSIYHHNGKRQFMSFDLVQFLYAFILSPLMFIWLKSFLFFLLRSELGIKLSVNQLFIFDSVFSLLFIYLYAFIVIHSLTKSFKIRWQKDPLYDIFLHSEYFHLWLSHIGMFTGAILLTALLGITNLFVPLLLPYTKNFLYGMVGVGIVLGVSAFVSLWLSNPLQGHFMRWIKVLFGISFLVHVLCYFLFDPSFSVTKAFYWMTFVGFTTTVLCSLFIHKSARALRMMNRLKDYKWGMNIDVLSKK